jgi:hypothetical protein
MSIAPIRAAIIAALCAALALLGGCSAVRLGYNAAPEFAFWWLDGYADFDDAQSLRVRDGLAQWFAWHRRTQLPDYAALLVRAQAEVVADTTPERACAWWDLTRKRLDSAFEQALPTMAELALTITPAQLQHLEARQAKSNTEFRNDFLRGDPQQRLQEGIRRAVDRAETIYGRLDDAQLERVARTAALSPFDPELALAERRARQQDLLRVLRATSAPGTTREQAQTALRGYAARLATSPREDYRRYLDRLSQFSCSAAAQLHNATSPAQRQAAVQRLKGWEGDLRALAADAL